MANSANKRGLGQYAALLSDYLLKGYQRDEWYVEDIFIEGDDLIANVGIGDHYVPPDGSFHLTAPIVFVVLGQLAIIRAHLDLGLASKTSEVVVTDFTMRFRRPINRISGIPFLLKKTSQSNAPLGDFFSGDFSVDGGSFSGSGRFLILRSEQ